MNNRCVQVSTTKLAKHGRSIKEQKLLQIAPKTDNLRNSQQNMWNPESLWNPQKNNI